MSRWILYAVLLNVSISFAQQNLLPIHSFYKDQLLSNKKGIVNSNGFYPLSEGEYDLISYINDSTKQYYDLTEVLFKKHLFEITGKDFRVDISPLLDLSMGSDLNDANERRLFQNTRGALIEVDLFNNFSFSTAVYENQARFSHYENRYYISAGELYPKASGGYQNNAKHGVIPGSARTKPFKGDGFDYAYAIGSMSYLPFKSLRLTAGNNQQFIGDGHRSLLLSDNAVAAPYFRIDWTISSSFRMTYHRSRLLNLLRRGASSSAEVYYESKGYSCNYYTYMPNKKINISLFEGGIWNRGDSLSSSFSHPLFYNPIPILSGLLLKNKNEVANVLGLNVGAAISTNHRFYGQLAINDLTFDRVGVQFGYRGFDFFDLQDFSFQLEWNHVPNGLYENVNPRLNYVQYNLPLAHSKGNGFDEILLRCNYMYKRFYVDFSTSLFLTKNYNQSSLLPIIQTSSVSNNTITNTKAEFGYRFNRKINLTLFGAFIYRTEISSNYTDNALVSFGLRTALINHYTDF